MKIINLIHYPIDYKIWENDPATVQWITNKGEACAIWEGNWSQILGNEILKAERNIEYEVWRPDVRADKVYTHVYPNGLVYKLFPSQKRSFYYGLKKESVYYSNELVESLENSFSTNKEIVLHINAAYRQHDKWILDNFYKIVPIVAQFYTNPLIYFENSKTNNLFKKIHRKLLKSKIDDYYKKIKFIIPSTQSELDFLEQEYNLKIFYRERCANYGIDFNFWDIDQTKIEAREKIGVDKNCFMFFCSSRLVPEKQIDLMINEFGKISTKSFIVYLSGNGSKEYENYLYKLVIENKLKEKVNFIGFVSEEILKLYYSACDVFLSTSKSEGGPFSTALAAFYEKPIITTNTGLVYELLLSNKSACYIDKDRCTTWHYTFEQVIEGYKIPICSKKYIYEFFNWDIISKYYINSYRSALKSFHNN